MPCIDWPTLMPPCIPSIFILVPAGITPAGLGWLPFTKAMPEEEVILSIGITSILLTATASDSLYNISTSFIFKASPRV